MNWKRKIEPEPQNGDFRILKRFAWCPTDVGDRTVWLETYQILEEWVIRDRKVYSKAAMMFFFLPNCGDWEVRNKRTNKTK